ncbi:hypothetical protein AB5I41_13115 [Sphingomonas sp. MMS24-JH45]
MAAGDAGDGRGARRRPRFWSGGSRRRPGPLPAAFHRGEGAGVRRMVGRRAARACGAPARRRPRRFAQVGIGMALDPAEYRGFLMAYARHRGAVVAPRLGACVVRDGRVERLDLADGRSLWADPHARRVGVVARGDRGLAPE